MPGQVEEWVDAGDLEFRSKNCNESLELRCSVKQERAGEEEVEEMCSCSWFVKRDDQIFRAKTLIFRRLKQRRAFNFSLEQLHCIYPALHSIFTLSYAGVFFACFRCLVKVFPCNWLLLLSLFNLYVFLLGIQFRCITEFYLQL